MEALYPRPSPRQLLLVACLHEEHKDLKTRTASALAPAPAARPTSALFAALRPHLCLCLWATPARIGAAPLETWFNVLAFLCIPFAGKTRLASAIQTPLKVLPSDLLTWKIAMLRTSCSWCFATYWLTSQFQMKKKLCSHLCTRRAYIVKSNRHHAQEKFHKGHIFAASYMRYRELGWSWTLGVKTNTLEIHFRVLIQRSRWSERLMYDRW